MSDPHEGLPPCVSAVVFDGRCVVLHKPCEAGPEFVVRAGPFGMWADSTVHPGFQGTFGSPARVLNLFTDDPTEAQAAFERGAEWVRTGEGP